MVSHYFIAFTMLIAQYDIFTGVEKEVKLGVNDVFEILGKANAGRLSNENSSTFIVPPDPLEAYSKLSERLQKTFTEISGVESDYKIKSKVTIDTLIAKLRINGTLRTSMNNLSDYLDAIDSRHEKFSEIYLKTNDTGVTLLTDFFKELISESTVGLEYVLKMMYHLINGSNHTQLFSLVNRHLQDTELAHCDDPVSSQQYIHSLFNMIIMQEMNAFIMIVTGHHYLQKIGEKDYGNETSRAVANTRGRLIGYAREVQKVMAEASTEIWRCGPTFSNQTDFIEVKGPFQGIIINDGHSNQYCRSDDSSVCVSPKKPPARFPKGKNVLKLCGQDQCCYNKMIDCKPIAERIAVCKADPSSNRRYDYIRTAHMLAPFKTDVYYGKKFGDCAKPLEYKNALTKVIDWTINICSFCLCTCMGNGWKKSDVRAISLMLQTIDFKTSKVIIGVRFFEDHGMIHLQIKEGILLPGGKIQNGSEQWQPINYIKRKFPSENPEIPPEYYYDDPNLYMKLPEYYDYIHISEDFKTISLSDVKLPEGYIVTGVAFRTEGNTHLRKAEVIGTPIEIMVEGTPFDFKTAQYTDDYQHPVIYVTPSLLRGRNEQSRKTIELKDPDVSIDAPRNDLYPGSDQIIDFRVTDYLKDAGQTIVPFLDTRPVETNVPLSGIGLHFTGSPGYGGFIAPKIFTFDINNYFDRDLK